MDPKLAVCLSWSLAAVLAACSGGSHPSASMGSPAITAQPSNQSIALGQTATFTVAAAGTPPLNYQWQRDGTPIAGATSSSYTTPAATAADSGAKFVVVVSNSLGTISSNSATLTVSSMAAVATDVVTYKNDLGRTGQNLTESILTPGNVSSSTFGLLRTLSVDGKVDAQPLYLSQLTVSGATHNVVFVATEHDSVYAFDADSGAALWHVSVLGSGESLSDSHGCDQVVPEIGITSTPVIDRSAGTHGAIYLVAMSKDSSSQYHQRLHALDVVTGQSCSTGRRKFPPRIRPPAAGRRVSLRGNMPRERRCCCRTARSTPVGRRTATLNPTPAGSSPTIRQRSRAPRCSMWRLTAAADLRSG